VCGRDDRKSNLNLGQKWVKVGVFVALGPFSVRPWAGDPLEMPLANSPVTLNRYDAFALPCRHQNLIFCHVLREMRADAKCGKHR
jgi:hypothetical protein